MLLVVLVVSVPAVTCIVNVIYRIPTYTLPIQGAYTPSNTGDDATTTLPALQRHSHVTPVMRELIDLRASLCLRGPGRVAEKKGTGHT